MSDNSLSRKPLHERSNSQSNSQSNSNSYPYPNNAAIRLVPKTPPRLLGVAVRDEIYSRTPLPTLPSHFLVPGKSKGPAFDDQFQQTTKAQTSPALSGSTSSTTHTTTPQFGDSRLDSATGSPIAKPKLPSKKRLQVHKDNKTFSLLPADRVQDEPISPLSSDDGARSPIFSPVQYKSSDSLFSDATNAEHRGNSIGSCKTDVPEGSSFLPTPATPAPIKSEASIAVDPIPSSPWNYTLVGGLRKVPKTPDLKQKPPVEDEPLPPLPERSDEPFTADTPVPVSHDLITKPSFHSTETDTTASENTNYEIYADNSAPVSISDNELVQSSSGDSNYQILGSPSPTGSVIYRPQTAPSDSENENYEVYGSSSPPNSTDLVRSTTNYSHSSLVVPPLKPRARRSNENFGYYKSRSRESLRTARTGSLTSITTVLSQQEAYKAIIASGSLIDLPILPKPAPVKLQKKVRQIPAPSSWAEASPSSITSPPLRLPLSHMNETPHVWSSQLSTVLSESDGGTERGSRSWSDARRSSGFPSTQSRHSRQMLSISSSLAAEEREAALYREEQSRSRTNSLEPPAAVFARNGRHLSQSSIRFVGDQDEYGDGITDMQDLRQRPSRTRLSNLYDSSTSSSQNGRTNTMKSSASSRANSLLVSTIPTWARLYYGSGERRLLSRDGRPASSVEGSHSRMNSFRSGSPNTDHFPLSIYSPRRRPREHQGEDTRNSLEIHQNPRRDSRGRIVNEREGARGRQRLRTWSMGSIWSPHLRHDRRATRRSVWVPPSVTWSTEGKAFGRRNIQVVMFIGGFLFPFAWMLAALLPLPPNPISEMRERDDGNNSTSNLDSSNEQVNEYARQIRPIDEGRYESARWWRQLNRIMSFVGVLIIAAIIVLVIVGLKQKW